MDLQNTLKNHFKEENPAYSCEIDNIKLNNLLNEKLKKSKRIIKLLQNKNSLSEKLLRVISHNLKNCKTKIKKYLRKLFISNLQFLEVKLKSSNSNKESLYEILYKFIKEIFEDDQKSYIKTDLSKSKNQLKKAFSQTSLKNIIKNNPGVLLNFIKKKKKKIDFENKYINKFINIKSSQKYKSYKKNNSISISDSFFSDTYIKLKEDSCNSLNNFVFVDRETNKSKLLNLNEKDSQVLLDSKILKSLMNISEVQNNFNLINYSKEIYLQNNNYQTTKNLIEQNILANSKSFIEKTHNYSNNTDSKNSIKEDDYNIDEIIKNRFNNENNISEIVYSISSRLSDKFDSEMEIELSGKKLNKNKSKKQDYIIMSTENKKKYSKKNKYINTNIIQQSDDLDFIDLFKGFELNQNIILSGKSQNDESISHKQSFIEIIEKSEKSKEKNQDNNKNNHFNKYKKTNDFLVKRNYTKKYSLNNKNDYLIRNSQKTNNEIKHDFIKKRTFDCKNVKTKKKISKKIDEYYDILEEKIFKRSKRKTTSLNIKKKKILNKNFEKKKTDPFKMENIHLLLTNMHKTETKNFSKNFINVFNKKKSISNKQNLIKDIEVKDENIHKNNIYIKKKVHPNKINHKLEIINNNRINQNKNYIENTKLDEYYLILKEKKKQKLNIKDTKNRKKKLEMNENYFLKKCSSLEQIKKENNLRSSLKNHIRQNYQGVNNHNKNEYGRNKSKINIKNYCNTQLQDNLGKTKQNSVFETANPEKKKIKKNKSKEEKGKKINDNLSLFLKKLKTGDKEKSDKESIINDGKKKSVFKKSGKK